MGTVVQTETSWPLPPSPSDAVLSSALTDSTGRSEPAPDRRPRILVVDADKSSRQGISSYLRLAGFRIVTAGTGSEALSRAAGQRPGAVITDAVLPDMTGLRLIAAIRSWSSLPILVMSVSDDVRDLAKALDVGATDYLTRPYHPIELVARLKRALRSADQEKTEAVIVTTDLVIDLAHRVIDTPRGRVALTRTEWAIVELLAVRADCLVSRQDLCRTVWGACDTSTMSSLRCHLVSIRRKLEPAPSCPRYFVTESGSGLRFVQHQRSGVPIAG